MSALTLVSGTRTTLPFTSTSLSTLASATYVQSTAALDLRTLYNSVTMPLDVILELSATPGTVTGNKQAVLYTTVSTDNSNFSTGPISGTTVTDSPNLYRIGALPLNTNATLQRKLFSVNKELGWLPPVIFPVVFNDSGVAWTTGVMFYTIIIGDSR